MTVGVSRAFHSSQVRIWRRLIKWRSDVRVIPCPPFQDVESRRYAGISVSFGYRVQSLTCGSSGFATRCATSYVRANAVFFIGEGAAPPPRGLCPCGRHPPLGLEPACHPEERGSANDVRASGDLTHGPRQINQLISMHSTLIPSPISGED